jgi:hypothetical protein
MVVNPAYRMLDGEVRKKVGLPISLAIHAVSWTRVTGPVSRPCFSTWFSTRDAPLPSFGSQRAWFPALSGTIKALRLPTRASAITYLFRFRRPRDPSYLCVRRSAPEGWKPPPGPGVWITGRPSFRLLHVDASGISQVSRRSILCLRSAPRPRSNRRGLAMAVMSVLPPLTLTTKASDNGNFEAHSRSFSTRFSYASRFVLPLTRKAGFRLAGWPLQRCCPFATAP